MDGFMNWPSRDAPSARRACSISIAKSGSLITFCLSNCLVLTESVFNMKLSIEMKRRRAERSASASIGLLMAWVGNLSLAAALVLVAGCSKAEIRTERIPKEVAAAPKVSWKLPTGWVEKTPSDMRVGSFTVSGPGGDEADVSIIPLPGVGGVLENVNRWRGLVSLSPISSEQLDSQTEKALIGETTGVLVDVNGTDPKTQKPTGILAAMVPQGETSWFFKMSGPDKFVAAQKPAFLEFLRSIRFASAPTSAMASSTTAPPPTAPVKATVPPAATPAPAGSGAGEPTWTVPLGWTTQAPGQMIHTRFAIGTGGANVTVSVFGGTAGGLLANVNRWLGELKLPAVTENNLASVTTPIQIQANKATVFEAAGSGQRTIAVMAPQGDQTWFFKIFGPEPAVTAEKAAFLTFVQSVRFP